MKEVIFLVLLGSTLVLSLTNVEVEFITVFLKFLPRSNCALIGDPNGLQHLARSYISSTYVPETNVANFLLHQEEYTTERIVLVVKGHDLNTYGTVFDELPNPGIMSRLTWIMILNTTLDLSLIRVRIPYNSEFFLVEPAGENVFAIREIFRERNALEAYSNPYGVWSCRKGLAASTLNFFSRRKNLERYPMTVLTMQKRCPSVVHCSLREIWFDLARYLNITTKLFTFEERMMLIWETNREVPWDVNLEPMTYDAYTFTTKAIAPIWKLTVFMHMRHESDLEFSWSLYFSVVWDSFFMYFLIWIACLSLWLTIFEYLHSSFLHTRRFNPSNGIFAVCYWICNQGGIYLEPNFSLLFVILMVRVVVLAVQILGTGTLVSFLALRDPYFPFYDLHGFTQDGTYRLATVNGSLSQLYFDNSPITEELSRMFLPVEEIPRTLTEATEMLCADGKFVVLADDNDLMALDNKNCEILRVPFPVATISCGIALEDESPFEFVFNSAFIKFLESGVIDKLRRKVYEELSEDKENHLHPVTFLQVRPFFAIMESGILLSLIAWTAEGVYHALKSHIRRVERRHALRHVTHRFTIGGYPPPNSNGIQFYC